MKFIPGNFPKCQDICFYKQLWMVAFGHNGDHFEIYSYFCTDWASIYVISLTFSTLYASQQHHWNQSRPILTFSEKKKFHQT